MRTTLCGATVLTFSLRGALRLRLTGNMLLRVNAGDPLTFAEVARLLILVALAASSLPAQRATKVDPMEALRYE